MKLWTGLWTALVALLFCVPSPAPACSYCSGAALQNAATLRQDAATAKLILFGTLANAKINGNGGTTDLNIERVLKDNPFLAGKKTVTLPRYQPIDPKNPTKFLVFCDIFNGRLDPYRGVPVKSAALVDYLKGALDLDAKDKPAALAYFFRHLDSDDSDVAYDAFLEFAKSNDQEVGQAAKKLEPAKLRKLIQRPETPANRLGLFAFLLGACGGNAEKDFLRDLIKNPTGKNAAALDGPLGGYIQLDPRDGWDMVTDILKDNKRPFPQRCAALSAVRFHHGWKGKEVEREVLRCEAVLLDQGDIADMAIEDLRKWKLWDLTADVVAQYGKKTHDAPIMKRCIVRYALCCPRGEATRFLADLRKTKDGDELIKDVEDSLQFEKK